MDIATEMWMAAWNVEERARLERWSKAWDAYFGNAPAVLKIKPGQADDNVNVNYVRLIVDKGVSFLFGQPVQWELDSESDERTPAEAWLDECVRVNGGHILLQKLAVNGGVCGHAFLKITPGVASSSASPSTYPRLINLSPEYVTVVCDPHDIDVVWRYVIQYPARGKDGERLVMRQTIERAGNGWTVKDEVSTNEGAWVVQADIVWPWAWPPIVDCQNLPSPNEYYGLADIEEDVLKLNTAINFTLSNLQRIIRFHAHPKTWGSGFNAKDLKVGVDDTLVFTNPDAQLHNLEMQSDLTSSIAYYERLKEALHETAHIPEVATGKLESTGQLSGVALAILYQPLLDRTEQKRLTYGNLLIELFRRLLDMAGYGANNLVALHWSKLLPANRLEELQAALLEKQIGVSEDTLLRGLGRDPDAEREKRESDSADMAEQMLGAFDRGE